MYKDVESSMRATLSILVTIILVSTLIDAKMTNVDFLKHYAKISKEGDVAYLLSYPRSGNTLARYIFEFVTRRPTMELAPHHDLLNIFLAYSFKELKVDLYARPLWKVHRNRVIKAQKFYDPERTLLVLLVRNYKEIAFRYSQYKKLPLFDDNDQLIEENLRNALSIWDKDDVRELYFENIAFFDQVPESKRLLIYYEDLVLHPDLIISQIMTFFEGSDERRKLLAGNYFYYKKRIHEFYSKEETALSNTDDICFYSKQYSFEQCQIIDDWVKKHHSDLWFKYLSCYDENIREKE